MKNADVLSFVCYSRAIWEAPAEATCSQQAGRNLLFVFVIANINT
jgi:hypothetical protein